MSSCMIFVMENMLDLIRYFKKKPHLQIILNTDDIEIVNPLGTHIKHTNFQCFITQLQIFHPSIGLNCMLSSYWRLHLCYIILSTRRNYSHSSGLTIKSDHLNLAICIKKSIRGQFWKRRCWKLYKCKAVFIYTFHTVSGIAFETW